MRSGEGSLDVKSWKSSGDGRWIEFVGLPGAGKSTIARALRDKMWTLGYRCRDKAPFALLARDVTNRERGRVLRASADLLWASRLTLLSGGMRKDLLKAGWHPQLPARYWRLMRTWAALVRLSRQETTEGTSDITIFDQGILQCLPSIYPRTADQALRRELTRSWVERMRHVLPDLVVLVLVDERTAASRIKSRPLQRTAWELEGAHIEEGLHRVKLFAEDVLPLALTEAGTPLLRVDGRDPPGRSMRSILDTLAADGFGPCPSPPGRGIQ